MEINKIYKNRSDAIHEGKIDNINDEGLDSLQDLIRNIVKTPVIGSKHF